MFNLFSKKENHITEVLVAKPNTPKRQYPQEVEVIHNEFFTAADSILHEAGCLLRELEEKDLTKGKRLAAIGFGKTMEAVVAVEAENKLATTKEIADLVLYYRVNYPNNKFITEGQVKQICEKYRLVFGGISLYKGFVPEKKLIEIENFQLKEIDRFDISKPIYFVTTDNGSKDWSIIDIQDSDFASEVVKKYINTSYHYVEHTCPSLNNGKGKVVSHLAQPELLNDMVGFKICAQLKDMEIEMSSIKEGYKVYKEISVPDPVVLQPVKGGYLIVCAWGDEASDEIVVNEINN